MKPIKIHVLVAGLKKLLYGYLSVVHTIKLIYPVYNRTLHVHPASMNDGNMIHPHGILVLLLFVEKERKIYIKPPN